MNSLILFALLVGLVSSQTCSSTSTCAGSPTPCCSVHGYCGTSSAYCGPGNCTANCWTGCQLGGANSCPAGQCCSQYGYCGTTPDYCSKANNCFSNCLTSKKVFVAYIPSWTSGYAAPCNLNINTLDPTKFTHLYIPFSTFDTTNFVLSATNGDDTSGWYTKVVGLKSKNPNLKVVTSVGGASFPDASWGAMVGSSTNRAKFISNAIQFARRNNFDGIDIDWEFPSSTSQTPQIAALFSAFRTAINNDAASSGKAALLLTIAAPNYQQPIDIFDFPNIQQYLDWINVMTYDYYGEWSSVIGANTAFSGTNSIQTTFSYLTNVSPSKLTLGFANYARTFTLASTSKTTPGSAFTSPGASGPCTSSQGTFSYYEVGNYIKTHPSGTNVYDSASKTPYFYYGNQWITYDNTQSLQTKVDYVLSQGLKGAMVWALDGNTTLTNFVAAGLGI